MIHIDLDDDDDEKDQNDGRAKNEEGDCEKGQDSENSGLIDQLTSQLTDVIEDKFDELNK